jgi:flagellar protein FlgJ
MNPLAFNPSTLLRSHHDATDANSRIQEPNARATGTASPTTNNPNSAPSSDAETARLRHAAQDFEAVFLRQMLSSLERTTKVSSQGSSIAGQGTYGSMIVDAVSEAIAKAGGLGLADVMAGALQEHQNSGKSRSTTPIDPVVTTEKPISETRPNSDRTTLSEDERISAQGFRPGAVPSAEIRTSAAPIRGPLADRRIR